MYPMAGRRPSTLANSAFLDAGVFIGALMRGDPRYSEARLLIDAARSGALAACTSPSVLCEVYAALTWRGASPPQAPADAAAAVARLVEAPSEIVVLPEGPEAAMLAMRLAAAHDLTARRIHDARHAATALAAGVTRVVTYDTGDWHVFGTDGMAVVHPGAAWDQVRDLRLSGPDEA